MNHLVSTFIICMAMALSGCAVKTFSYLRPAEDAFVFPDKWGVRRIYFREVIPNTFFYLATDEYVKEPTLVIRLARLRDVAFDASNAKIVIQAAGAIEEHRLRFGPDYFTFGYIRSPPNSIAGTAASLGDAGSGFPHRLNEARIVLPASSSNRLNVSISGLLVGNKLLSTQDFALVSGGGTFSRWVTLQ